MERKKIYFKKFEEIGKFAVYLVNGEYIRKELDENFVGHDQHFHLSFIPKYEFWIDKESNPEEHHFFIERLIVEWKLMNNGKDYEEASKEGMEHEKRERSKVLHIGKNPARIAHDEKLLKKIHKKLLEEYSNGVKVWVVDGKTVRDFLFVDYFDGGHDLVYHFIPENEIWIEDALPEKEIKFILLHELHERFLMGNKKDYLHAHRGATIVEDRFRENPEGIGERIREELAKNTGG